MRLTYIIGIVRQYSKEHGSFYQPRLLNLHGPAISRYTHERKNKYTDKSDRIEKSISVRVTYTLAYKDTIKSDSILLASPLCDRKILQ